MQRSGSWLEQITSAWNSFWQTVSHGITASGGGSGTHQETNTGSYILGTSRDDIEGGAGNDVIFASYQSDDDAGGF